MPDEPGFLEDRVPKPHCHLCKKQSHAHTMCYVCHKDICKKHGRADMVKGKKAGKDAMISKGYICSTCEKKKK